MTDKKFRAMLTIIFSVVAGVAFGIVYIDHRVYFVTHNGKSVDAMLVTAVAILVVFVGNYLIHRLHTRWILVIVSIIVVTVVSLLIVTNRVCPEANTSAFCSTVFDVIDLVVPDIMIQPRESQPEDQPIRCPDCQSAFLFQREPMYVGSPVHYCPAKQDSNSTLPAIAVSLLGLRYNRRVSPAENYFSPEQTREH